MPQKPSRATVRGHSPIPPGTPAEKIEGDLCQGTNFENLIPDKFGSRYVRYIEGNTAISKTINFWLPPTSRNSSWKEKLDKVRWFYIFGATLSKVHHEAATLHSSCYHNIRVPCSQTQLKIWSNDAQHNSLHYFAQWKSKAPAKALHLSVLRDVVARRSRWEKCDLRRNKIYPKEPKNIQVESGCNFFFETFLFANKLIFT